MNWTLEHDGEERTFAELGFSQLTRKRVSQGADEVTFVADGRDVDAPNLFAPFADTLVVRRDRVRDSGGAWSGGTIWFAGIVTQIPRRGTAGAESNLYRLAGPWWFLESLTFEKTFNVFDHYATPGDTASAKVYRQEYVSHCFLNLASTAPETPLGKQTTGQQIVEALNWALKPFADAGAPAPFQIGTVTPDVDPPFDEVRDITCAEVIHKMLRFTPDAVTWFDYTTSPPTFHCKRRAEMAEVNVALNGGDLIRELRIHPRFDLQSAYVLIRYEQNNTVDGVSWVGVAFDRWPDPLPAGPMANFNALRFTVDLQGQQSSTTRARLACAAFDETNREWWLARHPQFKPFGLASDFTDADPNNPITSFELVEGSVERKPTNPAEADQHHPRELVSGQIADWMNFASQRVTFSCKANLTFRNGHTVRNHPLTYQCLSTSATGGSFQNQQVSAYAEPIPMGLARKIYDAISVLQYEGELTLQEEEVTGGLAVGQLFNLTGGQLTEWSAMRALVQQVTENVDAGATTVEFGPPRNLSAGELVDLLRINRNRLIHYSPDLPISGSATAATEIGLGNDLPEKNSPSTGGFTQKSVVSGDVAGAGSQRVTGIASDGKAFTYWTPQGPFDEGMAAAGSVRIWVSDIAPADVAAGVRVRLQKVSVCKDGVAGKMYFLCSDFIAD
jgi:hypothetical protein